MAGLAGFFIVAELPNNKICNPIGKVFKRVRDGEVVLLSRIHHASMKCCMSRCLAGSRTVVDFNAAVPDGGD
jgi:hypothetical protein